MAWNEPGNNGKDPWGGKRDKDGPPDIDELFSNFMNKVGGVFGGGKNGKGGGGLGAGVVVVVLAVIGVLYIAAGVYQVDEKERAVVLHLGKYKETKMPGLHWNPPLIDRVEKVDVTSVQEWSTAEQMLTKDLNIVDIKMSVQFLRADPKNYWLEVRDPETSLRQAANSALRHVVGSASMHDVLTEGREQIAVEVRTRLQAYLASYKTGIVIDKVNIEESDPPREVQDAFDDVIKAREDEERFQNEADRFANRIIPEARGDAQRVEEEAAAYKEQVIAQAEGEAQRFLYLLEEYKKSPEVTRRRLYLDTVQEVMENSSKVMIDVENGNNMFYMPLDQIVKSAQASAGSTGYIKDQDIELVTEQVLERLKQMQQSQNSRRSRELR